jgi:hypothetical protein
MIYEIVYAYNWGGSLSGISRSNDDWPEKLLLPKKIIIRKSSFKKYFSFQGLRIYLPFEFVCTDSKFTGQRFTVCSDTMDPLNTCYIIYKNSVRTSQETHYVSATKPNRLMLFRETVAVYCENYTEHTTTLCGQKTESVRHRKHVPSPLQSRTD